MTWTDDKIAKLIQLWGQGVVASRIGQQIGMTKNAVIGKAHRLKLNGRESPVTGELWGPHELARLRDLWQSSATTAEIAETLGRTVNAVFYRACGKMKLGPRPKSSRAPKLPLPTARPTMHPKLQAAQAKSLSRRALVETPTKRHHSIAHKQAAYLAVHGHVPPMAQRRMAGGGIRFKTCQYIADRPSADDRCKCGKRTKAGQPWCKAHAARIFAAPSHMSEEGRARIAAAARRRIAREKAQAA